MMKADTRQSERGLRPVSSDQRTCQKNPALLVIGYGNQLRSDDGIGVKTAAAVEEWDLPDVRTIICHQLTPELAEPISLAERVVFVDASIEPGDSVKLCEIRPKISAQMIAHAQDPCSLLALAEALFDCCPSAYWLTIPIDNTAFGEELSPRAQRGMQTALEKIHNLAKTRAAKRT